MMQVQICFHAQVAAKLGIKEAQLELEQNTTWLELFSYVEQSYGLSLSQGVITLIDGQSIWTYRQRNEQIAKATLTIEVFPALAGG